MCAGNPSCSPWLHGGNLTEHHSDAAINPRPTGGVYPPPPLRFFPIAKKRRRIFLHSCSDNCSTTLLKILGPGHSRSGYQVRSSDPHLRKSFQSRHGHSGGEKYLKLSGFGIMPSTFVSRIIYIGDLRSGRFRDLPILSQCEKTQMPQILIKSVQIVQDNAQLGYC